MNRLMDRLLVMISKDDSKEPRFQINDTKETGILIGKMLKIGEVEMLKALIQKLLHIQ